MMLVFQRNARSQKEVPYYVFLSGRCLGMPCFDPIEFPVSSYSRPMGSLLSWDKYNWHINRHMCGGLYRKECPDTFDEFSKILFRERIEDEWSWKVI